MSWQLILAVVLMYNSGLSLAKMAMFGGLFAAWFIYYLYNNQEKMLYQPNIYPQFPVPSKNPPGFRSPAEYQIPFKNIYFTTPDGIKLHAWLMHHGEATQKRPTIIFFHANAGNMGFRLPNLSLLHKLLQVNIFIVSYRGYGESQGTPSEAGLKVDGDTALKHLQAREDIDTSRLFVFGRSLGGAVAVHVAHQHDEKLLGLILENTFSSMADMADNLFPLFRCIRRHILHMNWNSVELVTSVTRPVLFLAGVQDEVVPHAQMNALYNAASSASFREITAYPKGMHNDTWTKGGEHYMRRIQTFIEQICPIDTWGNDIKQPTIFQIPDLAKLQKEFQARDDFIKLTQRNQRQMKEHVDDDWEKKKKTTTLDKEENHHNKNAIKID